MQNISQAKLMKSPEIPGSQESHESKDPKRSLEETRRNLEDILRFMQRDFKDLRYEKLNAFDGYWPVLKKTGYRSLEELMTFWRDTIEPILLEAEAERDPEVQEMVEKLKPLVAEGTRAVNAMERMEALYQRDHLERELSRLLREKATSAEIAMLRDQIDAVQRRIDKNREE